MICPDLNVLHMSVEIRQDPIRIEQTEATIEINDFFLIKMNDIWNTFFESSGFLSIWRKSSQNEEHIKNSKVTFIRRGEKVINWIFSSQLDFVRLWCNTKILFLLFIVAAPQFYI